MEVNTYKRYAKATSKTDSEAESQTGFKKAFFRKSLKSLSTHKQRSKKKMKIEWEGLKIHSEVG